LVLLFSSIINYTKKSLRPHGLGDFSVRGVFLQPLSFLGTILFSQPPQSFTL